MAKLIRQSEHRYRLVTDGDKLLGGLVRPVRLEGRRTWRFLMVGRTGYKEFITPADCCAWLDKVHGLNVELIYRLPMDKTE